MWSELAPGLGERAQHDFFDSTLTQLNVILKEAKSLLQLIFPLETAAWSEVCPNGLESA
jgi:hypothetical protein